MKSFKLTNRHLSCIVDREESEEAFAEIAKASFFMQRERKV